MLTALLNSTDSKMASDEETKLFISRLKGLYKRRAVTTSEKFGLLNERDSIIREYDAHFLPEMSRIPIGYCDDMCPEKERYLREQNRLFAYYESLNFLQHGDLRTLDHCLAVKYYTRSAAAQSTPLPHEFRSEVGLVKTMQFLFVCVLKAEPSDPRLLPKWYDFIWDRSRAMRKEITQLYAYGTYTVDILERCVRFHIYAGYRLSRFKMEDFDQYLNAENLLNSLRSLRDTYRILRARRIACRNEAEFLSYFIIVSLPTVKNGQFRLKERRMILESPAVKFALGIYKEFFDVDYIGLFRRVRRDATFLQACLLHQFLPLFRTNAITVMSVGFRPRLPAVSNEVLAEWLQFDDASAAEAFLADLKATFGQNVRPPIRNDPVLKSTFLIDHSLVASKLTASVSEIINGGPVEDWVYPSDPPVSSFDSSSCYVSDPTFWYYMQRFNVELPEQILAPAAALKRLEAEAKFSPPKRITSARTKQEEKDRLPAAKGVSMGATVAAVPFSFALKDVRPSSTPFPLRTRIAQSAQGIRFSAAGGTGPETGTFARLAEQFGRKPTVSGVAEAKSLFDVSSESPEIRTSPGKQVIIASTVSDKSKFSADGGPEIRSSPKRQDGVMFAAADGSATGAGELVKTCFPPGKEDNVESIKPKVLPLPTKPEAPPAGRSSKLGPSSRREGAIVPSVAEKRTARKQPSKVSMQLATNSDVSHTPLKRKQELTERELLRLMGPHAVLNTLLNAVVDISLRRLGLAVLEVERLMLNTKVEQLLDRLRSSRLRRAFAHWRTWARRKAKEKSGEFRFARLRLESPTELTERQKLHDSTMPPYRQRMEQLFESWMPLNWEPFCRALVGQDSLKIQIRQFSLDFFIWRCALLPHREASTSLIARWALVQFGLLSCDEIVYYANCPESRSVGVINNYVAGSSGNEVSPDCIVLAMDVADNFSEISRKLWSLISTCSRPVQLLIIVSCSADQPFPEEASIVHSLGLDDILYKDALSTRRLIFSRSVHDFSEERCILGKEVSRLVEEPLHNRTYEMFREYSLVATAFRYLNQLFGVGLCHEILRALCAVTDDLEDVGKIVSPLTLQFIGVRRDRLLPRDTFRATIASWLPSGLLGMGIFSDEGAFDVHVFHELNYANIDENSKWVVIPKELRKRLCDYLQQLRTSAFEAAAEWRKAEGECTQFSPEMEQRLRNETIQVQPDTGDVTESKSPVFSEVTMEEDENELLFEEYRRRVDELEGKLSEFMNR